MWLAAHTCNATTLLRERQQDHSIQEQTRMPALIKRGLLERVSGVRKEGECPVESIEHPL